MNVLEVYLSKRATQKTCIIFSKHTQARWCGNELRKTLLMYMFRHKCAT